MILECNERGFGAELARHLLNPRDNDHVTVYSLEGFVANELVGAFAESAAIAQGTQCRKYLFSVSLNPPPGEQVPLEVFENVIARIEAKLGLAGQPRAIVFHEKNARRHAHCVWSRIDPTRMRAINLAHTKRKLMEISIALYHEHGWSMPEGFQDHIQRDQLNYSRAEAGQAKRTGHDPTAIKALFKRCWEQSDSRVGFAAALWAQGFCLAQGDRRGFVAVDAEGKIWSLSRWCDLKPKDLRSRLGEPDDLPSVDDAAKLFGGLSSIDSNTRLRPAGVDFEANRKRLIESQRKERDELLAAQERRALVEKLGRAKRLPRGLKAAWARLTGRYEQSVDDLAREAAAGAVRDRKEQQALIDRHLNARRVLERQKHFPDLSKALDQLFAEAVRSDKRQRLVLPNPAAPFTRAQLEEKPSLILPHLSARQASFSDLDVKRALAGFLDNPLVLRLAIDKALSSPELIRLADGSLTTGEYRDAEMKLDADARALAASGGFAVAAHHVEVAMRKQDGTLQERFGSSLSEEQRAALRHVLGDEQFCCVVGLAGSGKSTMLETAHNAWAEQAIKVHGAALSGKAAEGLRNASGIESRTLASLETSWRNGYEPIGKGDVLVVDEAGMVGTRQLMRVATKVRQLGAKLVLIGDPGQLQPIEAGKPFGRLVEQHGAAKLEEIFRQKQAWQRQASRDLAEGRVADALKAYDADGCVHNASRQETALVALLQDYLADRESGTASTQLAFAHRRKDVFALNQAIRRAVRLSSNGEPETILETETGSRAFATGDRIVFTRNEHELGVKNGMLGTVESAATDRIAVRLDGDGHSLSRIAFDPRRYRDFDHGYAVTIHKSQGATVDRAYVLASRSMDQPLTYVAMTRHRDALRLYVSDDDQPTWATSRPELSRRHLVWSRRLTPS